MSNISVDYDILNQKQTPAFYASSLATRPAFGFPGRIFIDTDTPSSGIYRDTGSAWVQVADPGAGTTGTLQQVTTNGNSTTLGISVQGISITDGAGTGGGNTGVGSSTLLVNTTGSSNTGIGYQSLSANTTGTGNTAIGQQSLLSNTTASFNTSIGNSTLSANVTGEYNTAIGESALSTQGTANNNTAVGSAALTANTTGTPNTAIGRLSLSTNTTGGSNTAIGYQSLYLNTTGGSNTAIGVGALQNNTTASTNTAIGSSALQNNSTGTQNTAIGSSALALNTTAGDNTSIGYAAMQFNTTGTGNTAIGSSSLRANTTFSYNTALGGGALTNALASNNTAIGYGTLQSTTGNNNTAIGATALSGNTTGLQNTAIGGGSLSAITTGSNNTAIGYASGGAITTGSNNTIIGEYVGTTTLTSNIVLADGLGNVRLFSDANGLIGINQAVGSVVGGQLDIHSTQTYALVLNGLSTSNAYTAFSNASVGKWRIGNTYNAGANTFDIYNLGTSSNALSFNSTTNAAIFSSSVTANQISSIVTSGTARVTIGDGAVSGGALLNIAGVSGGKTWFISSNYNIGGGLEFLQSTTNGGTTPSSSPLLSIKPTGELMVGYVNSSNDAMVLKWNGASSYGSIQTFSSSALALNPAGNNVLIGTTTDDTINKLQVTGSIKASSGVNFGNGSTTLNYYEEGSWTPTLGGTWVTNPTNLLGSYIRIGNMVFIRLTFLGGVKTSETSGWFDGLPFAGANGGGGTVSNVSVEDKGIALLDNSTRVWVTNLNFGGLTTKVNASYLL